jgi:hypothetical protein
VFLKLIYGPLLLFIIYIIYTKVYTYLYINSLFEEWKQTNHGKVFTSRNLNLDILLFAEDVILFANSEYDLQRSIYQFKLAAEKFSIKSPLMKLKQWLSKGRNTFAAKFVFTIYPQNKHLHLNISVITSPMKRIPTFQLK